MLLRVDPDRCTARDLDRAVAWLRQGGIVAFPTDTVYGLTADPASPGAVAALFALKGRAPDAALPFVAASRAQVEAWCGLSPRGARLAEAFWPGPLSILCDAPASIVPAVHAGLGTVAVRVPAHPVARALAAAWGSPLPATSANASGEPPAIDAAQAAAVGAARVFVIDGGPAPGGPPSTIVDVQGEPPRLVRAGAIAWERVLHSLHR